ncbi:N-acetylgalactosamine-6-sulfatase [Fulvitalea axinellae]|uniref:N-acetylgalactosamine-6-sulfatase n=1 Tax=Fulvitalea axinellae TaxID=1182444 RepID=A0AAU9CGC5_9BACT|nr:N-acetylgalactosamine-6-sulfatase [Fulvitalea axinellae]
MKRNQKLWTALLVTMVLAFHNRVSAQSRNKTNFIQFLTDDQGWGDLHAFGHPDIKSPHIDKLAEEGLKFTQCYSASSVCSPARSAILTGRTPYRNGVYRWVPANHYCYLRASEVTLPQLLKEEGYQTAHFGKWHLSSYSEERIPKKRAQYRNYGYETDPNQPTMNEYGYDYWLATGNVARPSHKNPQNFFLNGTGLGEIKGYSAQIVAKYVVEWIKEHREPGRPFFMTVWFHEPHGPVDSDPEFMKRYDKLKDESLKQYLANITQIDEAVGAIVKALDEAGETDNTLIWYTSDNGPEGRHPYGTFNQSDDPFNGSRYRGSTGGLRGRKRHTHEGGIRVPGIIKWPAGQRQAGFVPGSVISEPIIGSDVFPTLLEIAGAKVPRGVKLDGESIRPLLAGKKMHRKKPLYWRNNFNDVRIALRDGDWKVVGNSERTVFELYNIRHDPRETTDWATREPKRFERMKQALIEYDKEVLAEGPDWWKKEKRINSRMPEL